MYPLFLVVIGRFLNSFLARNPQLTPKIKDESEIEEIYNIKEELGRGTFGVVNRAEKDGKDRMIFHIFDLIRPHTRASLRWLEKSSKEILSRDGICMRF